MASDPLHDSAEIAKAAADIVKTVPIYQDAIQPVAKQIGTALETVGKAVNLALLPITGAVWGYEQIKEFVQTKITEKLQHVPPENIIPPKANIAVPAIEALRYSGSEQQLAELYANLLATAMNKETASGAHPAFAEIIKQLTSDEAKITKLFAHNIPFPIINIAWEFKNPNPAEGKTGGQDVLINYSHIGRMAGCEFEHLTPTYLDNLCRLGLAEIPTFYQYTGLGVYDSLEQDPSIQELIKSIDGHPDQKSRIDRKGLKVTPLGKQFIQTCSRS